MVGRFEASRKKQNTSKAEPTFLKSTYHKNTLRLDSHLCVLPLLRGSYTDHIPQVVISTWNPSGPCSSFRRHAIGVTGASEPQEGYRPAEIPVIIQVVKFISRIGCLAPFFHSIK
jgi:hypothetical protein